MEEEGRRKGEGEKVRRRMVSEKEGGRVVEEEMRRKSCRTE